MSRCPTTELRILAARGLRKQVKLLTEHVSGVRLGEDIECIHRVRVASRRLRAVLAVFGDCWKLKQVKSWKRQVRQLARDLSEARDCDVQIEFLVASLACVTDAALVPGIARLLSHAEQQRQWLQPRVLQAVDRVEQSGVLKDMLAAARRVLDEEADGENVPGVKLRCRTVKSVRKRLKRLLAQAPGLDNAERCDRHHAMRIAAKRLRYTLELVRSQRGPQLDATMETVKRLQTLLGEVHDCDVWAAKLDAFARTEAEQVHVFFGESRRFNRLLPGLVYLREERRTRREQVFAELVAYWRELSEKHVWERLTELLKSDAVADLSGNGAADIGQASAALT